MIQILTIWNAFIRACDPNSFIVLSYYGLTSYWYYFFLYIFSLWYHNIFKITSYSLRLFCDICVLVIFTVCLGLLPMYSVLGVWLVQLLCALAVVMFDSMCCVLLWVTSIQHAGTVCYADFDNWSICQGYSSFRFVDLYAPCRLIFTHVEIFMIPAYVNAGSINL